MREIKFRAWNKNGRMFKVGLIEFFIDGTIHINGDCPINRKTDDYILMQYTGLKDKNGKEIYEGDILRWSAYGNPICPRIIPVEWNDKNGSWRIPYSDETNLVWKIFGNIYENPELLAANQE